MDTDLREIIDWHHSSKSGFSRHYLTLYSIVLGLEARSVFEFGSGFSSKTILKALEKTGGNLISCDIRPVEETGNSQEDINKYEKIWTYIQGNSLDVVPKLETKSFDFVLHDGAHGWKTVAKDLRNIVRRMKKDAILLVHDTEHNENKRLRWEMKFGMLLGLLFVRHQKVTLPYGYGLTIVRINKDFGNGTVSTDWKKSREG